MATASNTSVEPQFRTIDGLSIRFAESENRDNDAILLSPWPESVYAYAPIWSRLAERTHLVAIDLPGFGQSERREDLMSPSAMGEFVVSVADAFGLDQPHVIGPDVGTGAALFAAGQHPGRLRSLVVGSGGTSVPIELGDPLKDWVENPDIEQFRHVDGRQIAEVAVDSIEDYTVPRSIREDYLSSYEGERFVESMSYVRAYPEELPVLRDMLPQLETPVQIIAGQHDTVVPPVNAVFLHDRLPNNKLNIIDSGHFTWESAADEYGELVSRWWAGGYSTTPSH